MRIPAGPIPVLSVLLVASLGFGVALWFCVSRYIGPVSAVRTQILIFGCLAGFGVSGVVMQQYLPIDPTAPWSWALLRPGVYSSACGMMLILIPFKSVAPSTSWRMMLFLWSVGTLNGSFAYCIFTELESRQLPLWQLWFYSLVFFESSLFGLFGWLLAVGKGRPGPTLN